MSVTGAASGWNRGVVDVRYSAGDNVGVRYARIENGGVEHDSDTVTCDYTQPAPCSGLSDAFRIDTRTVADGAQPFLVRAHDTASNWGSTQLTLNVDNTAPGPPLNLAAVGGAQWRSRNSFALQWRNPGQPGTAPIARVRTAVCPASADVEDWTACILREPRGSTGELARRPGPR